MAQISKVRRNVKPPRCECRMVCKPIAPCECFLNGIPGTLIINETEYAVSYIGYLPPAPAEPAIDGYRLTKGNGESHDLCLVAGRMECTCGDYAFRRASEQDPDLCDCKHIAAIRQLLLLPDDIYEPHVEEQEAPAFEKEQIDARMVRELTAMRIGEVRHVLGHRVERFASAVQIDELPCFSPRQIAEALTSLEPCKRPAPSVWCERCGDKGCSDCWI